MSVALSPTSSRPSSSGGSDGSAEPEPVHLAVKHGTDIREFHPFSDPRSTIELSDCTSADPDPNNTLTILMLSA